MQAQAIPPVVMAGIAFYVASYQLLIYVRRRDHREHLTFGLSCLAVGLYDVFCAGLYDAGSVAEGVRWQRAQFVALAAVAVTFIWFAVDYTGFRGRRAPYALSAGYAAFLVIQAVDRSDLTLIVEAPSVKRVPLPLGLAVTYFEATPGEVTSLQSLLALAVLAYMLRVAMRASRDGRRRQALPLIGALAMFAAGVLNDTLVTSGVYRFVYLIEYSYLGMIVLMAYSLSNTVVAAAAAKEALRASEERFRSLVETSSDWIWETDRDAVYTYASPQVGSLLGYEPREVIGKTAFDLMPPDEATRIRAAFGERARASLPLERLENAARRKDGRLVVLETSGVPFFDARGALLGYRGIDRDITGRKQAEAALQESEAKFRSVVENSPTGIFIVDGAYAFTYTNDELCRILGYSREEIIGRDFRSLLDDESLSLVADRYLRRRRGEDVPSRYEFGIVRRDGERRRVEISSVVIGDARGALRTMGQLLDVTERKRAEDALREKTGELERRNAELERFAYTVSHDLKSPLVTIIGFLGYLRKDVQDGRTEKAREDIDRVAQAADKMQHLLRELLELSRLGRVANPPETVPFAAIVEEAARLAQGQLDARGVRLDVASELPLVRGDRVRLVEVVQNLLDNACRFMGSQAEPRIAVGQRGADDGGKPILFVRDNGIGIDPTYHERIFGLFEKLDPLSEGTGIGLAVVKRIVEVHGGRVWVESEPGQGSVFCSTIRAPDR